MTMIIDGTNGLTFNNATTQASAGNVLQVVQATSTTNATTSSTSFVTTSFSATITPKFATSKVLILQAAPCYNNTANFGIDLTMYRGGTNIAPNTVFGSIYAASSVVWTTIGFNYLDSPATTSATTYTVYFKSTYGGTVTYNVGGAGASIILLGIAA